MKKTLVTIALACLGLQAAVAAPPAAPVVTAGATAKQLQFDWDIVPRSNYYELWFKANNGAPYVKFGEAVPWRPRILSSVSAHLLDWDQARYQVRACNPSGCGVSADVAVTNLQQQAIGYFKSAHPVPGNNYGHDVAMSYDGQTFVVSALFESGAPAAYIYHKVQGHWREEARIEPGDFTGSGDGIEFSLSYDGNVLAMSTTDTTDGVNAEGAVFIYRRTGNSWAFEAELVGGARQEFEVFGLSPQLNAEGTFLMVSYSFGDAEQYEYRNGGWKLNRRFTAPSGSSPVVASGDRQVFARCRRVAGAVVVEIQRLQVATTPVASVTVAASDRQHYCEDITIDYLGDFIAVGHGPRGSTSPAWDPEVTVIRRIQYVYQAAATLRPGNWQTTIGSRRSAFGHTVALSSNSGLIAVGDVNDSGQGHDVNAPPLAAGTVATGAVYVFQRQGNSWSLRKVLKPHSATAPATGFGTAIAFGEWLSGKTLVVGDPSENSGAPGIDGNRDDTSLPSAGAVWLY